MTEFKEKWERAGPQKQAWGVVNILILVLSIPLVFFSPRGHLNLFRFFLLLSILLAIAGVVAIAVADEGFSDEKVNDHVRNHYTGPKLPSDQRKAYFLKKEKRERLVFSIGTFLANVFFLYIFLVSRHGIYYPNSFRLALLLSVWLVWIYFTVDKVVLATFDEEGFEVDYFQSSRFIVFSYVILMVHYYFERYKSDVGARDVVNDMIDYVEQKRGISLDAFDDARLNSHPHVINDVTWDVMNMKGGFNKVAAFSREEYEMMRQEIEDEIERRVEAITKYGYPRPYTEWYKGSNGEWLINHKGQIYFH